MFILQVLAGLDVKFDKGWSTLDSALIEYLGGRDYLRRELQAGNFAEGLVISNKKTVLSFSYCINDKTSNFITFSTQGDTGFYVIEVFKVTLFNRRLVSSIENVPYKKIAEKFEEVIRTKLYEWNWKKYDKDSTI